jgi:hypothetical protein
MDVPDVIFLFAVTIEVQKSPFPGFISSCDKPTSLRRGVFNDTLYLLQWIAVIDFSIAPILLWKSVSGLTSKCPSPFVPAPLPFRRNSLST